MKSEAKAGLRAALLAGMIVSAGLAPAIAAAQQGQVNPGGGEVRGLNGGASPTTRLLAPPPPPPPEVGTALSPPTSKRVTDRSSLNGTWDLYNDRNNPALAPTPAIPPAPLKPQYQARMEARQKALQEAAARYQPIAENAADCLPEGFPGMLRASFPMEVLVTPGQITMVNEAFNQVRRIYLDEPQGVPGKVEPVWFGHAVAKWEGDTLVVDTIGVKEEAGFRNNPHSDKMRITERIRMIDKDHFRDDLTVVDPETMTGPWKFAYVYKRLPGYKMQEYVCEANRIFHDENGAQRLKVSQ